MTMPPALADFESITEGLSVRAKNVLKNLGINNTAAFIQLSRDDLLQTRNCGKKTADKILSRQSKLRPPKEIETKAESKKEIDFDNKPKEIFEAVQGDLSVRAINVLEALGVNSLKAFMTLSRKQLLNCRNCGRKTADEIMQIQVRINRSVGELAEESDDFQLEQLLASPYFADTTNDKKNTVNQKGFFIDVENPAPWLTEWVYSFSRSEKKARAFLLRKGMLGSGPMTLEAVGKQVGLTRQRIRQIDKAMERRASHPRQPAKLRPLINAIGALVKQRGGMVGLNELTEAVFCKGEDGNQLKFATGLIVFFSGLKIWKDASLLLDKDRIVRSRDSLALIRRLAGLVEEVASATADEQLAEGLWSIKLEKLKENLSERIAVMNGASTQENVSDALLDAVLKKCSKNVKTHKNRIYSLDLWRLRYGPVVQMVDTVLYQIGKPAHFTEVTEHVRKWRPGSLERNIHATLDRSSNALLWDRGTFIHKDKVEIPISLIHDVEHWLLEMLKEDVPFVSTNGAFSQFRIRCERAALPSETALYTCLRKSTHPKLTYPKVPYVYLKNDFSERVPIPLALEDFLRDAGGPVSQLELKEYGLEKIFLKDYQFTQLSQKISNVIRTTDWGYLHLDNAELDMESIQPLVQYAKKILTEEGHCSVVKIYRDRQVTCRAAGINGPMMLYSLFQCFAEDSFALDGYPRMVRYSDIEERNRYTIRSRILNFVRRSGKPCPFESLEERFVEQLGYKESQVYSIIREPDICLCYPRCVINYQALSWNEEKQNELERTAFHIYRDAVRAGMYFGRISHLVESPDLPRLPSDLHWSRTMIADLLIKGGRYLVLGNAREAFLQRDNDENIHSFEALVGKQLDCDWGGAANLSAFESALLETRIIKKHLTSSMLGSGQIVVIRDGEIILKELMVDA